MNNDFKKPVNYIPLTIGIIGVVLSIIFFLSTIKKHEISYLQNGDTSLIFDSKSSSPAIKLYVKDSVLITKNIYIYTGQIWNSGDFPIEKTDIRVPIIINLNNNTKILDFKILKERDAKIALFSFSKVNDNLLRINWKYFDPNYGFRFQIIYESKSESGLKLTGKLLNIDKFNYLNENDIVKSTIWAVDNLLILIFFIACIFKILDLEGGNLFYKIYWWVMTLSITAYMCFKIINIFKYLNLDFQI